MWQQVAVYLCVAAAALYLGTYFVNSIRAIVKARSGCGDGCGNCAFAARAPKQVDKPISSAPGTIIPLTDVRSLPRRKV